MEAAVDGGGSDGDFAAAINVDDGMVAAASTAATQLTMNSAIAATTIGQRRHLCQASSSFHPTATSINDNRC